MIIKPEMISGRITKYDLLPLSFLKKSPYTGSKGTLRYRIEREVIPLEADNAQASGEGTSGITVGDKMVRPVQERIVLRVFTWNGPNAFDMTSREDMAVRDFDFSEEALEQIIEYLNEVKDSM